MPTTLLRALALVVVLGTCLQAQAEDQRYKKFYEEAYVIKNTNPKAAKAKLRQVLELAPPNSVYIGKAQRLLRQIEQAGDVPEDEQAAGPTSPLPAQPASGPDKARAIALREQGTEFYKKDEYSAAAKAYQQALKLNPRDYDLHRLIGSVYARMGRRKAAYRAYDTFVKRCPKCMYAPTVKKILADYRKLQHD